MSNKLTTKERQRLEQLIEDGQNCYDAMATILREIHTKKLYREDYKSFEAFTKIEFGISKPRAHQLINHVTRLEEVSTMVDGLVLNERQTRELDKVETKKNRAVVLALSIDESKATGEPLTAKLIKKHAKPYVKKPTSSDTTSADDDGNERGKPAADSLPSEPPESAGGDLTSQIQPKPCRCGNRTVSVDVRDPSNVTIGCEKCGESYFGIGLENVVELWNALESTETTTKSNDIPETPICRQCGNTYSRKQIERSLGEDFAYKGYCSAKCYTAASTTTGADPVSLPLIPPESMWETEGDYEDVDDEPEKVKNEAMRALGICFKLANDALDYTAEDSIEHGHLGRICDVAAGGEITTSTVEKWIRHATAEDWQEILKAGNEKFPPKKPKRGGFPVPELHDVERFVARYREEFANNPKNKGKVWPVREFDEQAFLDHFNGNGWRQSNGMKLKGWEGAARNWGKRDFGTRNGKVSTADDWEPAK